MQNSKQTFPDVLFTPAQIAARWHQHPETIRRKIREGEINSLKLGRKRLVRESEVARHERAAEISSNN